jgi:hypothetical protein
MHDVGVGDAFLGCDPLGLGDDRSQLLRDALHRYLVRLRAESDIEAWLRKPMSTEESSLGEVANWGPAEDWSDWA